MGLWIYGWAGRNEHGQDLGEAKAWTGTWWLTGAGTSVLQKAQCLQVGSHGILSASPGPRGALSALLRPCSLALWLQLGLFLGSHRIDEREARTPILSSSRAALRAMLPRAGGRVAPTLRVLSC